MSKNKINLLTEAVTSGDRRKVFGRYGDRPSFSRTEKGIRLLLSMTGHMTVAVTASIIFILFFDALFFFQSVNVWDFLTGTRWEPFGSPKIFGVLPLLSGTLMISFGSALVAMPIGFATAVYMTQYAGPRFLSIVNPCIEILGGIPTVVYGYFALTAVTPHLKNFFPGIEVFNALSASLVVGISIIPMVSSMTVDAMQAVPVSIKNAGYSVGLRKIHIVTKIIIPASVSGTVASFMLAFARAVGETMIVTLAAGSTPKMSWNYLEGVQTMTAYIVQVSLGDTPAGSIEYYTIYAIGLTLFMITFIFNYLARRFVRKYAEVYR
jgi:phosphate transport system permease protein